MFNCTLVRVTPQNIAFINNEMWPSISVFFLIPIYDLRVMSVPPSAQLDRSHPHAALMIFKASHLSSWVRQYRNQWLCVVTVQDSESMQVVILTFHHVAVSPSREVQWECDVGGQFVCQPRSDQMGFDVRWEPESFNQLRSNFWPCPRHTHWGQDSNTPPDCQ